MRLLRSGDEQTLLLNKAHNHNFSSWLAPPNGFRRLISNSQASFEVWYLSGLLLLRRPSAWLFVSSAFSPSLLLNESEPVGPRSIINHTRSLHPRSSCMHSSKFTKFRYSRALESPGRFDGHHYLLTSSHGPKSPRQACPAKHAPPTPPDLTACDRATV